MFGDVTTELDVEVTSWLGGLIERAGGVAGTVHRVSEAGDGELVLVAAVNIPPRVREITARIPKGKGMAGLAWERGRPVSTCNLQTDASGDVRPGAKAVDAQAAVALPVHDETGATRAIVGIAFANERVLTDDEVESFAREAQAGLRGHAW
jgi:hypothetical protein